MPEGLAGVGRLHALLADHAEEPDEVVVGIEIDRGLLVAALVAAGYQVYAINPKAVSRYRDRHTLSGAKSDSGDAKVLADLVRTDRHHHRRVAGDSDLVQAITVTARAHQNLVWTRQRQVNQLRQALRAYYPGALAAFGTDLAHPEALEVLTKAPSPELGRRLRPHSSARRSAAPAGNATSTNARLRSATACAPRSWPRPRRSPTPTATPPRRCWASSPPCRLRSPSSRPPWRSVLTSTRTPTSCAVFPDSA